MAWLHDTLIDQQLIHPLGRCLLHTTFLVLVVLGRNSHDDSWMNLCPFHHVLIDASLVNEARIDHDDIARTCNELCLHSDTDNPFLSYWLSIVYPMNTCVALYEHLRTTS